MTVAEWLEEIKSAKKREKDYLKDGEDILKIYSGEKDSPFNILYSNTETLLPALFSQLPRPVVQRRWTTQDETANAASKAAQRCLEYLIDTDMDKYESFTDAMVDATLDGLLPGRGITNVRYDSDDDVSYETACPVSREWNRVYFGFARKWKDVPWIAYEEYLDKKEAERLFKDKAKNLTFTEGEEREEEDDIDKEEYGKRKTTLIYQIWDKDNKEIVYISPQYKEGPLLKQDDPLGLTGFFNCPKPITFVRKTNSTCPTSLYSLYENQAEELNKIQKRINKVVEAIKVRGAYNGNLGTEIENILKEDDNALIPTDSPEGLVDGGFEKNIWMLPLQELMAVLQNLVASRESAKRVIYEITGISDIVRGQSMASETLGAQKIKESWGTMRLKRLQKEVQRYALDMMKLMLEVAATKFSEDTWAKMTGLPYSTEEQVEKAQMLMQSVGPMDPSQPVPPQVQQAKDILKTPSWKKILEVLKDDFQRSYRIDIETNSTLDVEATEDKELVGDFMNAMGQLLSGVIPMVEKGIMPFPAAKSLLLAIVKRFRFGVEVEEELKAMKEPKPQLPPQMQEQMKKFQDEQKKFEQEKKRVGEMFDKEAFKIKSDKQELDFQKKLAEMQLKHDEELKEARLNNQAVEIEADLESMFVKQKSALQSMLDKYMARLET